MVIGEMEEVVMEVLFIVCFVFLNFNIILEEDFFIVFGVGKKMVYEFEEYWLYIKVV